MKLTLLTNYDAASALALSYLTKGLPSCTITALYTRSVASKSKNARILQELSQFEQSLPELPQIFEHAGAKQVSNVNKGADFNAFLDSQPDLVLSVRHMTIIKDEVIKTPEFGVINLHSGRLPTYQGVMATFWAMKNKEVISGTTAHAIVDSNIDTGPVFAESQHRINYGKSYFWNTLSLYREGCQKLANLVRDTADSGYKLDGTPQSGTAHYYSFPTEDDLRRADFPIFTQTDSLREFL